MLTRATIERILLGWAEHAIVGLACVGIGLLWGEGPVEILTWTTAVGAMHEGTQGFFSDFRQAANPPAPWNGILDLLAFLLPALAWWGLHL